jgi:Fe-S-cluster-containing hydrogenase component 2
VTIAKSSPTGSLAGSGYVDMNIVKNEFKPIQNHTIAFIEGKCIKCGICEGDCPQRAIHPETGSIDSNCIRCHHCVALCPTAALSVNGIVPADLKTFTISSDDFINLLKAKRSVRRYATKNVEPEKIQQLVEAFKWVPTAKNARQSFLTVVTEDKIPLLDERVRLTLNKTFKKLFNPVTKPLWYLFAV